MIFPEQLVDGGEHPFQFVGVAGMLEGVVTVPEPVNMKYVAILGHPHSLQGGTMNNKVVTTLARAFKDMNIPSIRFNFRGVGQSQGQYDAGLGESEDMLAIVQAWCSQFGECQIIYAGFSFGSYVAYRAAAQSSHGLLLTVAPPVHHYDYMDFAVAPAPWLVMQGDTDEVVPMSIVLDFSDNHRPKLPVIRFSETGHFFHGRLLELKTKTVQLITEYLLAK